MCIRDSIRTYKICKVRDSVFCCHLPYRFVISIIPIKIFCNIVGRYRPVSYTHLDVYKRQDDEIVYDYLVGIPVLGYANAGTPLVSTEEEHIGMLKIDRSLVGKKDNLFSLIIKGDSMDRANIDGKNIQEGNYVIVQRDSEVRDGDIVVAIIENSATVKKFKKIKDMIVLYPQSSNPQNQPIYLDRDTESIINGKVIKVLENPSI